MNLTQRLFNVASRYDKKVAVHFKGQPLLYEDIMHNSLRCASLFIGLGIKKNQIVAFQVPKSLDFLYCHLGNLAIGGVTLPLNTAYKKEEMEYFLVHSQAVLFVTTHSNYQQLKPVIQSLDNLKCLITDRKVEGVPYFLEELSKIPLIHEPDYPSRENDPAMIFYTSGTTGRPKGAMITHRNLLENMTSLKSFWKWTDQDVLLHVLPLFHIHGLVTALHGALNSGCTTIMAEDFEPRAVWLAIEKYRCTMLMGVPTMYYRMLKIWREMSPKPDIRSMRVFISGSAPLSEKVYNEFRESTGMTLLERYGMTETGMNTSNPLSESGRKAKSVGYPLPGVKIRIVNRDDPEERDVEPGQIGEVWIKGRHVFKGYYRMPDETAASFSGDWFRSGDLGYRDPNDKLRLYLVARAKELIITGGYNVYPKEVEEVLDRHGAIEESAVVGLPDEDYGERVVAVIVKKKTHSSINPVSEEEIIRFCKQHLAGYKSPKEIFSLNQLPRNAMGKVQKNLLKEKYAT